MGLIYREEIIIGYYTKQNHDVSIRKTIPTMTGNKMLLNASTDKRERGFLNIDRLFFT